MQAQDELGRECGDIVETTTLAGGCFWCLESIFKQIRGVTEVRSGYMGGTTKTPKYEQVKNGNTGHAEVVQIQFDASVISFADILEVFWHVHDPTTLNRQGADVGTQYRSAIFTHTAKQAATAEASRAKAEKAQVWPGKFVTEISPASEFTEAEAFHQDFYARNPAQPYCVAVIDPKVRKFRKGFAPLLK